MIIDTDRIDTVPLDREHLDRIAELLEICDTFLRRVQPRPTRQLNELLRERGISGGAGWLIDIVGLTALQLRVAASHQAKETSDE